MIALIPTGCLLVTYQPVRRSECWRLRRPRHERRTNHDEDDSVAAGSCSQRDHAVLVGAVALPRPERASALRGQHLVNEEIVRKYYAAWEKQGLGNVQCRAADNFT